MLYREIIAVCSEIHTKHINTLCGQNVELLNVKLAVHIVTFLKMEAVCPPEPSLHYIKSKDDYHQIKCMSPFAYTHSLHVTQSFRS